MNWDDNYTDTAYVFTSKGLPNSWNSLDSLEGNEFIITKLLPSKYSGEWGGVQGVPEGGGP